MSTDAQNTSLLSGAERRGMMRDVLAVVSSSHLATACGVLQNLIVLSIVSPRLTGIWTAVRSILDYANYSSLGMNRAAGIDVAVAAGRHDSSEAEQTGNVTMTVEVVTAGLVAVSLVAMAVVRWLESDIAWSVALLAGAVIAILSRFYAFNLTMLRSFKRFPTLARARAVGAVTELGLFVTGAYFFNFYGMLAAAAICQFANACYIWFDGGLRFAPAFDWATLRRLLAIGWPLAAEAVALSALRNVDRFVIFGCLANGEEQLGWYKIAIMMGAWAFDQSNLVAGVLFPRLGETLGRTKDPIAVIRLGLRAAELVALGMIPCVAALLVVGVPIVDWLLPAYRPGLGAAAGLVTAASVLGTAMPLRYALLTIGRTRSVLGLTGVAAFLALAGGFFVLYGSNDIVGTQLVVVSWTGAAAAAVLLVSTLGLCVSYDRGTRTLSWKIIATVTYLVAGALLLKLTRGNVGLSIAIAAIWISTPVWRIAHMIEWRSVTGRL